MGHSLTLLFALLTIGSGGSADEALFSLVRKEKTIDFSSALSDHQIKELVTSTLGIDLADGTYSDVGVTTHDGYLVVHLFGNDYSSERVRLQREQDGSYSVLRNFVYVPEDQEPCPVGTCPDESIRVLVSGSFSNAGHISRVKIRESYDQILAAGIKAIHLGGSQENRTAIMNWLACKKLILWGRIGHGSQNAISFSGSYANGDLTPQDMASNDLHGKILIIESCYVFNQNFIGPLKQAGIKFFAARSSSGLPMNRAEEAWRQVMVGAARDKKELNALVDSISGTTLPYKHFGKVGNNPAYYEEISR